MATFEYNALTASDRLMKGTIEAVSIQEAEQVLKNMQLTINSLGEVKQPRIKTPIGRNEFLLFNQQLASITKSGIPLERGLRELSRDIASKSMRKLINEIAEDLEAGIGIEQAFNKRQKHFPTLYGRILKAGVETGRLSEMLASLNRHLETSNQTRRIVFEATAYPLVILILAALIITVVFIVVIPQFEQVMSEMTDRPLPGLTRFFFALSRNILSFWSAVAILVGIVIGLYAVLSSSAGGRRFKESIILKLPVFGMLYHSSVLSKMAESMSMMISAGFDMPTVLRLSAQASGSEKIITESEVIAGQIEQGVNILEAGQFCKVVPRLFLYSIQLGSQRNELQDNLYSLGQMYYEQVRCSQTRLQTVMLPLMLVLVGAFIFAVVLSMFLPIVSVISGLSSS